MKLKEEVLIRDVRNWIETYEVRSNDNGCSNR